jgi:hypothetical protein
MSHGCGGIEMDVEVCFTAAVHSTDVIHRQDAHLGKLSACPFVCVSQTRDLPWSLAGLLCMLPYKPPRNRLEASEWIPQPVDRNSYIQSCYRAAR